MFRRFLPQLLAATALCAAASGAQRVTFVRTVAADHAVPGDEVVILYALGDNEQVRTFVDVLVDRLNRNRAIPINDVTQQKNHIVGDHVDESHLRKIRRDHPADAYLGVNRFTCESLERSGEVSSYDVDNQRVKHTLFWVDTICHARVDLLNAESLKRTESFEVKGEGTSQRVTEITAEERNIAAMQAARYAAISASELMTPHVVRESVELDESAPGFEEARDLIDTDRLAEARQLWERLLSANGGSAALHYNLAAVCEAMGDMSGAQRHYESAQKLSPDQPRYRRELSMFQRRAGTKK